MFTFKDSTNPNQVLPDSHGASGRIRTCDPRLRRPLLYPAELRALGESSLQKVVGETGFEPATPCTQNKCATKLRHSSTILLTLALKKALTTAFVKKA